MEKNQTVGLGFGTLILIAFIVLIFGSGPSKKEIEEIHGGLRDLQTQVSSQTQEIQALKEMVIKLLPPTAEAPTSE